MHGTTLRNFWHPIGTSAEIIEEPKQFVLLGEQIVAYRDDGGVAAFRDLCIHRGAALSGGRVKDGRLTCPYHGWAYDRTGACVHIPSLPPGAPIPTKARAIAYHAREAYGLVWVAMDDPPQPFPEWPDNAWDRPDYRVIFVNEYLWKASAGRIAENAMDFSHFNFVHTGYTELADGPVIKPHDVYRTERGLNYSYDDGHLLREYTLDFPFIVHDRKRVVNVGTGRTWSDGANSKPGDATILSFIAAPITESLSKIYVFVARNHSLDADDRQFSSGFDVIMDQDRVIVEAQRPEQIPIDIKEELHLKFPDAAAVSYRKMLRELHNAEAFLP